MGGTGRQSSTEQRVRRSRDALGIALVTSLVHDFWIFNKTVSSKLALFLLRARCAFFPTHRFHLAVAFLEEAQGLLSSFICVYLRYIAQGGVGSVLVGCYEPTAQVLLYPYTRSSPHAAHRCAGGSQMQSLTSYSTLAARLRPAGSMPTLALYSSSFPPPVQT